MVKLAIFDLDGTVCNTIEDLADATNYAMRTLGHPTHDVAAYKYFVGNGIPKLIYRALPEGQKSEEEHAKAMKLMLEYYAVHFADKSAPYDGIVTLLEELKAKGIRIAVCTNKAHHMALEIAEKIFGGVFDEVIGQSDKFPLKPDPTAAKSIMAQFGATEAETVFVGDSGVDMRTASNLGVTSIGVLWGFRTLDELKENGGQHFAAAPSDISNIINKL